MPSLPVFLQPAGCRFNVAQRALLFITFAPVPLTIPHDFIREKVTGSVISFIINAHKLALGALLLPSSRTVPALGNSANLSTGHLTLSYGKDGVRGSIL